MQDPELVTQLKERLPETLFEKFNGSLSIDQDRLKLAEYKVRVVVPPKKWTRKSV
jgi:hypothetical protein